LSEFHPHAVEQIAAKAVPGGTAANLVEKAAKFAQENKGLPSLANIKNLKKIGEGSTGAKVGTGSSGAKFVVKDGGGTKYGQEQVHNEVAADKIYKLLGAAVPPSKVQSTGGKAHKVAAWVEGQSLGDFLKTATPAQADAVKKKLQQSFVATALLGNWDVMGQALDNVKVASDGTPYLIDNGGSFDIAATATKKGAGEGKPYAADGVPELKTLLDPNLAPKAAAIFKGVTPADIKAQIGNVVKQEKAILDATPAAHKDVMAKRIAHLKEWAAKDGKPNAKKLAHGAAHVWIDPAPGVHIHTSELSKISHPEAVEYLNHITPAEYDAVRTYTGSSYKGLNKLLFTKQGVAGDPYYKKLDDGLQGAYAKAAKIPPTTLVRKFSLSGSEQAKFIDALTRSKDSAKPMKWRNYQSAGPGGTWSGNMKVTIENVTEGALDVKPISQHPSEEELLLNRGTFYKVKSLKKNSAGGYDVTLTQIPKAEAEKGPYMEAADMPTNGIQVPGDATPGDSPKPPEPNRELSEKEKRARDEESARHFAEQFLANLDAWAAAGEPGAD
jgi:hypothetical protein